MKQRVPAGTLIDYTILEFNCRLNPLHGRNQVYVSQCVQGGQGP